LNESENNCECIYSQCQFVDFLKTKNFERENLQKPNNGYCIFHSLPETKEKFTLKEKEDFETLVFDYIDYKKQEKDKTDVLIDFSNVVFTQERFFRDKKKEGLNLLNAELDFTKAVFLKNIRFDNIKCKKIIFQDTEFLDGGGIKNREKDKNLQIKSLIFKPYRVDSDFVIDIGQYINRDTSLIELKQGIIEEIQFENHKIGDGYIFFIGLNKDTEAHFENMLLDKVYFQNCNLEKCYFLNAKIENTEFRSCEFPWRLDLKWINSLQWKSTRKEKIKKSILIFIIFIIGLILAFIVMNSGINDEEDISEMTFFFLVVISFLLLLLLLLIGTLNIIIEFILYYFAKILQKYVSCISTKVSALLPNTTNIHKEKLKKHISIADEHKIFNQLESVNNLNKTEMIKFQKTLLSLEASYSQLQNNFKEKDFQVSGDFFYTKRYIQLVNPVEKSLVEFHLLLIHHLTNGFGERFVKPFIWLFMTFFIFTVIFTFILKPNQHYIATPNTPLYLVTGSKLLTDEEKPSSYRLDAAKSFMNYLDINQTDNTKIDNTKVLVGFNKKGDYSIASQKILQLKDSIFVGSLKSLSNIAYPFSINTKKWFQDITKEAFTASILETVFLWYFAGAFMLALWRRIKR